MVAALGRGEDPNSRGDWAGRGGRAAPCLVKAAFVGHVGVVEELLRHPRLRPNALLHIQGVFFDWSCLNLAMFKSLYKIPYSNFFLGFYY